MGENILGNQIGFAFKKATTWHTPVACGAGDGILVLPGGGIVKSQPIEQDPGLGDGGFPIYRDLGNIKDDGKQAFDARYRAFELLWAMLFGTAGTPAQQAATAAYLHTLRMAASTNGLFGTAVYNEVSNVLEHASAKVKAIELSWENGSWVKAEVDFLCDDEALNVGSGTNTVATFANVTVPDSGHRIHAGDAIVRVNAQSGGALGSGDVIAPTGGSIRFELPIEGLYVAGGGKKIDEPKLGAGDGQYKVEVNLKMPRYGDAAEAFRAAFYAKTENKADIVFTGPIIESTYAYYWKFQFPRLIQTKEGRPEHKKGRIPYDITLEGMLAAVAPTGMTGLTKPINLDIMTTLATDPLA